MGGHVSTVDQAAKARSDEIDRQIEQNCKRFQREIKILVLGSEESGKSTIVKQMKIVHRGGFSDSELADYRPVVYKNVLDSAQQVIIYMMKTGLECAECSNRALAEKVLEYQLDMQSSSPYFPIEIAEAINQLWKDPIIPKIMEHSSDFHLRTLPHKRKKWMHCFELVTSIIFCTALSEYDQVLLEEKARNRMLESLVLFESVINSRWFLRTSIILLLTKIDVFRNKLPKVPLERYISEYTGGSDINKAAKYILWKFMQANRA